jgi:sarcosine oxidase subunit beta
VSSLTADVVVVGGGVLGASTAYHLACRGLGRTRAVLVERGSIAAGPTGYSSAIIRQNYSNPVTARMAFESVAFFQNFAELTGEQCGYHRTGCLSLAAAGESSVLRENVRMQRGVGIEVREVTHVEALAIEPHLSLDGSEAVAYEADAGYADPALTAGGMAQWARAHGVQLMLNSPVHGLIVEHGRIQGVVTARGEVRAPTVLLATGPWTNQLLEPVGVCLPIDVNRHGVYVFARPPGFRGNHPVVGDFPNGVYFRAEGADLTLVGSLDTVAEDAADPDNFASRVTLDEAVPYAERLVRRFPVMADAESRGGWAGLYDVTPDWHPILDAIPEVPGLYVAAGTSGHGFKLSPAIGRRLAGLVTGDAASISELRPFRRDRFAVGELFVGRYSHSIVA